MKTENVHKEAVTKDMIIADVLKKYPDVAVIMLENGLHCVGCHANVFDTIEGGSKLHGMDEETIDEMVKQINVFVGEMKKEVAAAPTDAKLTLTDAAAAKLKELMHKEKQEGFGLKISVMPGGCSGFVYQMNFEKEPEKTDVVITDKGVKVFVDAESLKMLAGASVDYVDNLNE